MALRQQWGQTQSRTERAASLGLGSELLASGGLSSLSVRLRGGQPNVTEEQTNQVSPDTIKELAAHAKSKSFNNGRSERILRTASYSREGTGRGPASVDYV